jgi:hypothetical protein
MTIDSKRRWIVLTMLVAAFAANVVGDATLCGAFAQECACACLDGPCDETSAASPKFPGADLPAGVDQLSTDADPYLDSEVYETPSWAPYLGPGESPQRVQALLEEGFATSPLLLGAFAYPVQGVLVSPRVSGESAYALNVIVDSARPQQQAHVMRFLASLPFDAPFHIEVVYELPLRELVAGLNLAIDARPSLDGCRIDQAHYATGAGNQASVVFSGRVNSGVAADQRRAIEELYGRLQGADARWSTIHDQSLAPNTEPMIALGGSARVANEHYALGLDLFWAGRFAAAERSFAEALVEAPASRDIRYWRVLSILRQGDQWRARRHMAALLRRGAPSPQDQSSVFVSLERVQGPVRRQLLDLEESAVELLAAVEDIPGAGPPR